MVAQLKTDAEKGRPAACGGEELMDEGLSYICGLIVWPLGRSIRNIFCDREKDFKQVYNDMVHTLGTKLVLPMGKGHENEIIISLKIKFPYIWSCLQTKTSDVQIHEKIRLINRYRVMQAVFEG